MLCFQVLAMCFIRKSLDWVFTKHTTMLYMYHVMFSGAGDVFLSGRVWTGCLPNKQQCYTCTMLCLQVLTMSFIRKRLDWAFTKHTTMLYMYHVMFSGAGDVFYQEEAGLGVYQTCINDIHAPCYVFRC